MKTLLKILAVCLPMLMFSQKQDSLAAVAKQTAQLVIKEKKSIDSIRQLKEKEVHKQITLLRKLRALLAGKANAAQVRQSLTANNAIMQAHVNTNAIRTDSDTIYWEEVRRKWTGRLFNKSDTRIRLFRFENGRKVYLN